MNAPLLGKASFLRERAERMLKLADRIESEDLDLGETAESMWRSVSSPIGGRAELTEDDLLELAKLDYRSRQQRYRHLPLVLFGEPAWDILLDLFIAAIQRRLISVSSACLASAAPFSTALRHLGKLERKGLVERIESNEDQRVVLVKLTDRSFNAMVNYYNNRDSSFNHNSKAPAAAKGASK